MDNIIVDVKLWGQMDRAAPVVVKRQTGRFYPSGPDSCWRKDGDSSLW